MTLKEVGLRKDSESPRRSPAALSLDMEGRLGVNEDAVSVIVGILHPHGHVGLKVTDGSVIYELGFGIVFGTFDPVVQNSLICLPVVSYATDYLQRTDIEIFLHTKIRIHIEEIGTAGRNCRQCFVWKRRLSAAGCSLSAD